MPISRTAQVLKYFAQQYQAISARGIPRLRLMKMAYMTDVLAREFLSGPITGFNYYRYRLGPYDKAIIEAIDELVAAELAEVKIEWGEDGDIKRLVGRGAPITFEFSAGELEVMKYVADNYMAMEMRELLHDVVYLTPPMLEARDRDANDKVLLNMDQLNGTGREKVGFRLDDVLRAEQAIRAGRFVTAL
jgi:hypothetical protein